MTDNEQRHPDIEIYIKDRSVAQISDWLETICDSLESEFQQGQVHHYIGAINGTKIPVMIHEKVSGKAWTSVWFNSDQTPWLKDLDCARQAATTLNTQIRCIASGWNTGDEPDEWWKVDTDGQAEKCLWRG